MYTIIKNVIGRGGYDLSGLLTKINTLWVEGSLTTEQKEELILQAQNGADTQHSVDVLRKLEELDRRVKALEQNESVTPETIEEFVVGKWYYTGDACLFNSEKYTCIAPAGVACVWSPADYPAYWEMV